MGHRLSYTLAAAVAFATASLIQPATAESLRSIRAFPQNLKQISVLYAGFQKAVTDATKGEITFQDNGPETVPPFEQFEPLTQGVFDLMYTAPSYHQAQTGIGVGISAIPQTSDPELLTSSGVRTWLNDYYRKNFGVMPIAVFTIGETVFVFREPLTGDTRLEGRKVRSNASYEGIVRALGGAPVAMGPADAYAALEKGTLDGVVWPEIATAEFKLYEVTKFLAKPTFGKSHNAIFMNAAKFDALPKDQQDAIVQAGLQLERDAKAFFAKQAEDETRIMTENGVGFTEFSAEVAPQLEKLYVEGQREIAMRSRPDDVKALFELADKTAN